VSPDVIKDSVLEFWAISELPFDSVSNRVLVQNLSYGNEFEHMNGRHVLTQRQNRKWRIVKSSPPTQP